LKYKNLKVKKGFLFSALAFGFTLSFSSFASAYTGSVPVSLTIPPASLNVQGYAAPGALVTIYNGSVPMATVTAAANGQFNKIIPSVASGLLPLSVSQKDQLGLESAVVAKQLVIPPQQLTTVDIGLPPTIKGSSNTLVQGDEIVIFGYAAPGQQVSLYVDNPVLPSQQTTSGPSGYYEFKIATNNYYIGNHVAYVKSQTPIGESTPSKVINFSISQQPNTPGPPADRPSLGQGGFAGGNPSTATITNPPNNTIITEQSITVSGAAIPNSQVLIYVNGGEIGSVFADSSGNWSFVFYPKQYENILQVSSCINGICSDLSQPITLFFKVLGETACRDNFNLDSYIFNVTQGQELFLQANYPLQQTRNILIDWGDGTSQKFSVPSDVTKANYKHTYAAPGFYNGSITSVFQDNTCQYQLFFSAEVKPKTNNLQSGLFIGLLVFLAIVLALATAQRIRQIIKINKTNP
jgi:hypothetical protein